ncbi:MAG: hypothetical protein KDE14_01665 [Rhodobacteraceae bacterium]|nr:hypothetical protein [Paracoccaceae bacterium]
MTDHDSDPYSDLADYIEGAPAAAPVVAPHPALAGSPQWLGEDDGESEGTPPDDAASISLEVIAVCAREPQNDTGNGQRLLHHFGQDLLNVRDVGWHAWTGTHWEREGGQEIAVRRAQATATRIVLEADFLAHTPHEAALIEAADDTAAALAAIDKVKELTDEQKARKRDLQQAVDAGAWARAQLQARQIARRKYAVSSGNAGKIRGMLDQALPHRTIRTDELDGNKRAFNVANGTLHFIGTDEPDPDASDHSDRTVKRYRVELRPHDRADNISKVAPVEYDRAATCPRFLAAVKRFQPIEPVRKFVQRYHGYALTGLTGEQCLIFNYGTGSNWKSTFTEIVARIMGPYCATIAFESLAGDGQKNGSQASPDIARLPGARLVRASEPERGVQFKEALIKSLTGGEPMLTRHNFKDFFEFTPDFKLSLAGNHKPQISGVDEGIWRRINFVPWPVSIAKHERRPMNEVLAELWEERAGILNWLIAGALDYLNHGLRPPQEVIDATADYREEMDPVGTFCGICVEAVASHPDGTPASTVPARQMYDAFAAWAENSAVRPWREKSFAEAMATKGFQKERHRDGVRYLHVTLKNVPTRRRRDDDPPHPADNDELAPV